MNFLFECSPIDPATGIATTYRFALAASQGGDSTQVDGLAWEPAIVETPVTGVTFFQGGRVVSPAIDNGAIVIQLTPDTAGLAKLSWDGALGRVWTGTSGQPFTSYTKIFEGVLGAHSRDADRLKIPLYGLDFKLDETPLLVSTYAGTGGAEGPVGLRGILKPKAFGACRYVAPVKIDPAYVVFQVHDGATGDITAVYENGLSLGAAAATVSTYAALTGLTLAAGTWAKCPALGLFRLANEPSGKISADVSGPTGAGSTLASIALALLDLAGVAGTSIDTTSINTVAGSFPWNLYVGDQVTIGETLKAAFAAIYGYLLVTEAGLIAAGSWLADGAVLSVAPGNCDLPIVAGSMKQEEASPPVYFVTVNADRCWSVHSDTEISPAIYDLKAGTAANAAAASAAQAKADQAAADILIQKGRTDAIVSDNVLDRSEKAQVALEYQRITNDKTRLNAQASSFSITTENTNFNTAFSALASYLSGLSPAFSDSSADTPIVRTTWNSKWGDLYDASKALDVKIAVEASKRAGWSYVVNDNGARPENNADLTSTHTAALLAYSGSGAYANNIAQLNASEGAKFTSISPGASSSVILTPLDANSKVAGNRVTKTGPTGYNTTVVAQQDPLSGYGKVSLRFSAVGGTGYAGLWTSSTTTPTPYLYFMPGWIQGGNGSIYWSTADGGGIYVGPYSATDIYSIIYDGKRITGYRNGVAVDIANYGVPSPGATYYLQLSCYAGSTDFVDSVEINATPIPWRGSVVGDGAPSDYAGSNFKLATSGYFTFVTTGNSATMTNNNNTSGYNGVAYSVETFKNTCHARFRVQIGDVIVGLQTAGTQSALDYTNINYSIANNANGNIYAYELSAPYYLGPNGGGDALVDIVYDGRFVKYYINGSSTPARTVAATAGQALAFKAVWYGYTGQGKRVYDIVVGYYGDNTVRDSTDALLTDAGFVTNQGTALYLSGSGTGAYANNLSQLDATAASLLTSTNSTATAAQAFANDVADNSKFSADEKKRYVTWINSLDSDVPAQVAQANALSLTTQASALSSAYSAFKSYLVSVSYTSNSSTSIVRSTFQSQTKAFTDALTAVVTALDAKSATLASWSGVSGTGKPADFSTRNDDSGNLIRSPLTLDQLILANGALRTVTSGTGRPVTRYAAQLLSTNALARWGDPVPVTGGEILFYSHAVYSDGGSSETCNASFSYYGADGSALGAINLSDQTAVTLSACAGTVLTIDARIVVPNNASYISVYVERPTFTSYSFFLGEPMLRRVSPPLATSTNQIIGLSSTVSSLAYSTDQGSGSGVTITIPAHVRKVPNARGTRSISYGVGSLSNRAYSTFYVIYCVDPGMTGGAVTWYSSTNPDDALGIDKYHYATIQTTSNGGTTTTGSGGGGSSTPPAGGGSGGFGGGGSYYIP